MKYKGSCHCGKVAFEVEGDFKEGIACNCSLCSRRGSILSFVPREALRLTTDEKDLRTYLFNKHVIKHHFCPDCGIHPYGEAKAPNGVDMAAVNVRCLEDFDLKSIKVQEYDGLSK